LCYDIVLLSFCFTQSGRVVCYRFATQNEKRKSTWEKDALVIAYDEFIVCLITFSALVVTHQQL